MNFISFTRFLLNIFDYHQQKKIINFFKKKLDKNLLIFDVGAHHGETVFLFKKNFILKKIYCFEASSINYKVLKSNIERKKLEDYCSLYNLAAGEVQKDFFINQSEESSSSSINQINKDSKYYKKKLKFLNYSDVDNFYKKIPIKMITLNQFMVQNKILHVDILKIDTEGYELNVLKGLADSYKFVKFIYFEHHYDNMIKKNYTFSDINNILLKFGFKKVYKTKMIFRKSFEYIYKNNNL